MSVTLDAGLLAGILAAQVAQLGLEGRLIQRLAKVETRVEERTTVVATDGGDQGYRRN